MSSARKHLSVAGVKIESAWLQWLLSMALGAAITWGMLQSRLSALETDNSSVKTQVSAIRDDVREIRTYLLGKKRNE